MGRVDSRSADSPLRGRQMAEGRQKLICTNGTASKVSWKPEFDGCTDLEFMVVGSASEG